MIMNNTIEQRLKDNEEENLGALPIMVATHPLAVLSFEGHPDLHPLLAESFSYISFMIISEI